MKNSIDSILGNSQQRYFGAGYKQVKHHISRWHIDTAQQRFSAMVSIDYPPAWSTKNHAKELQPHLSTIDAFVIAVRVCDAFISACYLLEGGGNQQVWLRAMTIKAGRESTLDLQHIDLQGELVRCNSSEISLNGYISEFSLHLGGFNIVLELDHSALCHNFTAPQISLEDMQNILSAENNSIFGSQYTHIVHHIMLEEPHAEGVDAELRMEKSPAYHPSSGLAAAYAGCINPLDLLICGAQISQVLIYKIDNLQRGMTQNLWMRSVRMYCPQPLSKAGFLPVKINVRKTRLLEKEGGCWRTADMRMTSPCDADFYIESSMAHEIKTAQTIKE